MKKRSREINIFSMSALDLFASALGAFILITVILLPYFPNTGDSPERVAEVRAAMQDRIDTIQEELQRARERAQDSAQQLQRTQQELEACRSEVEQARNDLETCQEQLRRQFLLILISWGRSDDVDLHVVDPQGREFYYAQRSSPGTPAKMEEDNTQGPGNEIWLHPEAGPGQYEIHYKLFRRDSANVVVRGAMLTPEGKTPIPDRTLSVEGRRVPVAIVHVDDQGNMRLEVL